MEDRERLDWLRLARTSDVGPATFSHLLARFGSASAALKELPRITKRGGGNFMPAAEEDARREWDALKKAGGRLLLACDPDFPAGLAALTPPPPVISVLGTLPAREMIAIVGARNASALGRKFASLLARDLAEAGLAIVSGLARGIDSSAHESSLEHGTVAVVAGGVDVIYPPENESLYRAIVEKGAVISEMPFGEAPQARHFPRRNRLISGLSRGVIVVEAAEKSGSLITADYALEQGREIFAVPGSPLDLRARGANRLIRDGATLIESAQDVLAVLNPILGQAAAQAAPSPAPQMTLALDADPDQLRRRIEEALGTTPVEMDELIRQLGADPSAVQTALLELELAGRCRRHPGNWVSWAALPAV
jgi:DNA processing protein